MIWVMVQGFEIQGWVSLGTIPVESEDDYRCMPEGLLDEDSVRHIADDIRSGQVWGCVGAVRWYRQAVSPRMVAGVAQETAASSPQPRRRSAVARV